MFDLNNPVLLMLIGIAWIIIRLVIFVWVVLSDTRAIQRGNRKGFRKVEMRLTMISGLVGAVALFGVGWWIEILLGWRVYIVPILFAMGGLIGGMILDLTFGLKENGITGWLLARNLDDYRQRLLSVDADERLAAARILRHTLMYTEPAIPDMVDALKDTSADVRAELMLALFYSDSKHPELTIAARRVLNDSDLRVRAVAGAILIDPERVLPEALQMLIDGLTIPDVDFANAATFALGRIGSAAVPAIPNLEIAIMHRDPPLEDAILVLERIGVQAVPTLIQALGHPRGFIRYLAVRSLSGMEETSPSVIAALEAIQNDEDLDVRREVIKALTAIRQKHQPSV